MTQVLPCNCIAAKPFKVKSGGVRQEAKPVINLPFHTIHNGAQFQDALYGRGLRLHNVRTPKGKVVGATCTVCGERKSN